MTTPSYSGFYKSTEWFSSKDAFKAIITLCCRLQLADKHLLCLQINNIQLSLTQTKQNNSQVGPPASCAGDYEHSCSIYSLHVTATTQCLCGSQLIHKTICHLNTFQSLYFLYDCMQGCLFKVHFHYNKQIQKSVLRSIAMCPKPEAQYKL